MSHRPSPKALLVLGATSKLWRLAKPYWLLHSQGLIKLYEAARAAPGGGAIVISDYGPVEKLPQCDVILSLWGVTDPNAQNLTVNVDLARRSLDLANMCGASRVLFASTGAVYSRAGKPQLEDDPTPGLNAYGRSKRAAEQVLQDSALSTCALRLANVAGADALSAALRSQRQISLDAFDDGRTPVRSFIGPDDFARVLVHLIHATEVPKTLNVAGPHPVEMADIVQAAGRDYETFRAGAQALPYHALDTALLKRLGLELHRSGDPAHLAQCAVSLENV